MADETEKCTVRRCQNNVFFTKEHLCRHHGIKQGLDRLPVEDMNRFDADPRWTAHVPETPKRKPKVTPETPQTEEQ